MSANTLLQKTGATVEKTKKMDNKTTRMAENDLIDAINRCFSEYNYYSMKSLRARLRQPEAYLREVLDKVANLNRSGAFANLYSLKPEFRELAKQKSGNNALPEENTIAPAGNEGAEEFDEDEEDIKMEDVLP
jgi:transcription initiation factor TFIIF subunit beta